jgi:hypothetical protein
MRVTEPPPPEILIRPWAEDPELLRLISDLLTAARRKSPEYLMARIAQLTDDLALHHDIDVVEFDGGNAELFDVAPSVNPADIEPRTVRPALVHHGVVVRAGEVRTPRTREGQSS